jgi:hypothetical protein
MKNKQRRIGKNKPYFYDKSCILLKGVNDNMAEYDILVECQVIIDANNEEEAKDIAIKNIQNCLDPYYIEAFAD